MQHPISDTALRAFRHMRRLERQCSCLPRDWDGEYWKYEQCTACAEWWVQNSILHDALQLRPWQWPAIENPATENPYLRARQLPRTGSLNLRHKCVGAR
jgi:hypothetical protein